MSTQAVSPNENQDQNQIQNHLATDRTDEHRAEETQDPSYADMTFVLDEPWRVKILPQQEPEKLPPGVLPKPEPFNPRQQPWRPGDVTRLKDDTPEGMMKYIATHTTGWWQEMAQRALRDTERAQRRAEEAGVQYGQYWTLELDAETKEKLRLAEEARRLRAEAERAKEEAAKEAFAQRQRELLEKAGRAPRCEYRYTDGRGCRAPQVRGERWCHGHAKMMSYRPERLELVPMEDEQSVAVNLYRVTKSLASGRITEKMAGLMLWSVAIGAPGARRTSPQRTQRAQTKPEENPPQIGAERRRSEEKKVSRERTRTGTNEMANGLAKPKTEETLPRINADDRGLERSETRETLPLINADDRGLEQGCASRDSGGSIPRNTGASLTMTSRGAAKVARRSAVNAGLPPQPARRGSGDPGVTDDKSFVFGVDGGGTPIAEIALIHGKPGQVARDQEEKPKTFETQSKRGSGRANEHEQEASVLNSTELHSGTQDQEEMTPTIMKVMPAQQTSSFQGPKAPFSSSPRGEN